MSKSLLALLLLLLDPRAEEVQAREPWWARSQTVLPLAGGQPRPVAERRKSKEAKRRKTPYHHHNKRRIRSYENHFLKQVISL